MSLRINGSGAKSMSVNGKSVDLNTYHSHMTDQNKILYKIDGFHGHFGVATKEDIGSNPYLAQYLADKGHNLTPVVQQAVYQEPVVQQPESSQDAETPAE